MVAGGHCTGMFGGEARIGSLQLKEGSPVMPRRDGGGMRQKALLHFVAILASSGPEAERPQKGGEGALGPRSGLSTICQKRLKLLPQIDTGQLKNTGSLGQACGMSGASLRQVWWKSAASLGQVRAESEECLRQFWGESAASLGRVWGESAASLRRVYGESGASLV